MTTIFSKITPNKKPENCFTSTTPRAAALDSHDVEQFGPAIHRYEEIQNELWTLTVAIRKDSGSGVINPFLTSVNQLMDSRTKRVTKGLVTRMPPIIW
ncbi:MAG: hypothetical protein KDA84_15745 [Planctomycetaceae bacterium]|nr:hypothetical protein [Planctomycetaceae bacterium]